MLECPGEFMLRHWEVSYLGAMVGLHRAGARTGSYSVAQATNINYLYSAADTPALLLLLLPGEID